MWVIKKVYGEHALPFGDVFLAYSKRDQSHPHCIHIRWSSYFRRQPSVILHIRGNNIEVEYGERSLAYELTGPGWTLLRLID